VAIQLNNSVARAFSILGLFSERRPELTAGEVAQELGLNVVTAHRFLRSLAAVGALVAVARGRYRLGYLFADLGSRVVKGNCLAEAAQPVLDRVTADMNEASMATLLESNMVSCIAVAHSGRTLSVNVRVGTRMEAYCAANGKVWLSRLPRPALERFFDEVKLEPLTGRTIVTRGALERELEKVRREGYAINDSEREEGLRAIAVPVTRRNGEMLTAISVFGPTSRMSPEVMDRALARLRRAAGEIEAAVYGRKVA
jgi:DNA-binding IclR family transcriptional regulator